MNNIWKKELYYFENNQCFKFIKGFQSFKISNHAFRNFKIWQKFIELKDF